MDPITLVVGLVTLGASAVGYFKQQEENDKAKQASGLAIQQAEADLSIQKANNDYGVVAAELIGKAKQLKAQRELADLTLKRTQIEKKALLGLALVCLAAVFILALRSQASPKMSHR